MTIERHFWTDDLIGELQAGQARLIEQTNHRLIKAIWDFERIQLQALRIFKCAIMHINKKDWLVFPYDDGYQLYSRDIVGRKIVSHIAGGNPQASFFSCKVSVKGKPSLFIAKSPCESMRLFQLLGNHADIVGLFEDQPDLFSDAQASMLNEQVVTFGYESVYVFLDCNSESAYANARHWATKIKKATGPVSLYLVNIARYTTGVCTDIRDCVVNKIEGKHYTVMLQNAEPIQPDRQIGRARIIGKEALRLPDDLLDVVPPLLKDYLAYSSPLTDAPNEFLITPFLACLGALIGKKRFLKMGGISLYPTIWTVLFAGSSELHKSTALSLAKGVFKPVEEVFQEKYKRELAEWTEWKKQCEEDGSHFNEPELVRRTLFCSDSFSDLTFWQAMRDNGSLVSMPGEFTSLWNELSRPRNGMKDFALSIFDAEDLVSRETKSAGRIELYNPVFCIASATTVDNFRKSLTSQELGSGLLQRILPVFMDQRNKKYKALTELPEPDEELFEHISSLLISLMDLESCQVSLSEGGNHLFTEWSHALNKKASRLSEHLSEIPGFAERLSAYGLKFALIFQQFEEQKIMISEQNMRAATMLCDWLFGHIRYMLGNNYIFNRTYTDRLKIRELLEKQPNARVSRTYLMRQSHFSKEQLNKALASEIEAGFIREIKTETAGRPLVAYELNKSK